MMQTFMDQVEFFHVGEGMLVKMTKYFGLPKRSQDGSCERPFSLEDAEEADAGPSGGSGCTGVGGPRPCDSGPRSVAVQSSKSS